MTNYSLLLGNTGKMVVWENWHINPFQVFYTAMFLVTAYVEQLLWKAQRQHWIGPLCSWPYLLCLTLSQTLFLQQLYSHIWSPYRIGPLRELLSSPKQPTWTFGRYLQKAVEFYTYTIILLNNHTPKIRKCKIFTSLSAHVSEQEEKLQHVEVSFGIPHKWGILIKQNQIWMALKEKTKLVCSRSRQ